MNNNYRDSDDSDDDYDAPLQRHGNPLPTITNLNNQNGDVVRSTDFVLTINTQQLVSTEMESQTGQGRNRQEEVDMAFDELLNQLGNTANGQEGPAAWLDFPAGSGHGVDNIQGQVNIVYVPERVPEGKPNAGRYHWHVLFQIRHNSNVRVSKQRLADIIRNHLNRINIHPYVFLRFARSTFDAVIKYMRKDLDNPQHAYDRNWRDDYDTEEE